MITTNNDLLASRLRLLRNLAFGKPRFLHQEAGYNFRMTGYQAAMGLSQFEKIERIVSAKRLLAQTYNAALAGIPGLQLPTERPWAKNVYWMYGIVVSPSFGIERDALIRQLENDGIETRTFFCPMNLQPFLQRQHGHRKVACPVAERLWENGMYLPSSVTLSKEQITYIAASIRKAGRVPS